MHVEGLTEEPIACAADAMRVLAAGAGRRQVWGRWSRTRACIPGNVPHEGVQGIYLRNGQCTGVERCCNT